MSQTELDLEHLWHTFHHLNRRLLCMGLGSMHDELQSFAQMYKNDKNTSQAVFMINT